MMGVRGGRHHGSGGAPAALEGASAPTPPVAEDMAGNSDAATVQPDGQRALPAPQQPDRPRGRHEAQRRRAVGSPAGAAIAVVIASVAFAGMLATWLIGSAKEPAGPAKVAATNPAGPTSRPPGAGAFGNLVVNWSFEQDLNGWRVLGPADSSREPQGRTS